MRFLPRYISKLLYLGILVFSLPVALYLLSIRTNFFGRAGGEAANLEIDSYSVTPRQEGYHWQYLAQGGEERTSMIKSVVPQVKTLNLKYIRIDHLYDFYDVVTRNPDGTLSFNWMKLDDAVNDILATGAKPFFSLSDSTPPTNMQEWQLIVQRTVEHFSRDRKISDVYYEVWNEPDLFGGYRQASYFNLYYYSAIGARSAQNTLPYKIGGPATTALYENWLAPFLNRVSTQNLAFDFYSWHRYSKNIDDFERDYIDSGTWLYESEFGENIDNVERIISESGFNSEIDKGYDSSFGAIHTLAVIAVLDGHIDKVFGFEIKDGPGPEKNWGRWGLLTHDKFGTPEEKPRFKAYQFLNQMTGDRVFVDGLGSWVKAFASKENNKFKILVVNYDPEGKHVETVPISVSNLENGSYTITRKDFLGGSRQRTIEVVDGLLKTIEFFPVNSAAMIELTPL